MSIVEHHSVIIIGAGLSGLYAAWKLKQEQPELDIIILEARERTGGRILSPPLNNHANSCIDMGPAWVWPDFQPRLQSLVSKLDLKLFKQNTQGDRLYEFDAKTVKRYADPSSHENSYRIAGGAHQLISALQADLSDTSIYLNTQVTLIEKQTVNARTVLGIHAVQNNTAIKTPIKNFPGKYSADHIILALPPRISQKAIAFSPPLDNEILQLWRSTPTWMAGHCKIVFIYDEPFWREQGLSGEVFSQYGPLSEIYDGSPENEAFFALTSFIKLGTYQRKQTSDDQLKQMCMLQLHRLFGDASQQIKALHIQDWSLEEHTTTEVDLNSIAHHPQYPLESPRSFWNKQLILAGTEVAREHGGYIEGALESAEEAIALLS